MMDGLELQHLDRQGDEQHTVITEFIYVDILVLHTYITLYYDIVFHTFAVYIKMVFYTYSILIFYVNIHIYMVNIT